VVGIERHSDHTWTIVTEAERRDYDAVVIAAPYHTSQISLPADLSSLIPTQPYIHLHVTLLTTAAATANPEYFGYKPGYKVPTTILTSLDGLRRGGKAPEFNSLSYHGQAKFAKNETHDRQGTGEWVAKIFSMERISDEWLAAMFQNEVGWVVRKEVCSCNRASNRACNSGTLISSGTRILSFPRRRSFHLSSSMMAFST
jgi:prenylcysteine oxidase/farnesylcysteine lyase